MTNNAPTSRASTAFFVQAILSFGVALGATLVAVAYMPVDGWMRGLMIVGLLYVVTSTFTLSKCVRDQQEASSVVSRVDQARLERLLAEYDPFGGAPAPLPGKATAFATEPPSSRTPAP
ncbi:hypothetical protein I6A84_18325 [Frankia sp. CNm7]|uniref:YiaAB two helix domain-containing protein n=1 Tax=Frankia nepalensis TaxID=1836974 RepID=A0A937UW61_9ACTN|nr:YiaA/YiaB family inner membrane protein [Frankia nepalensis]MBL7498217.1 hypothetical protein [Frankia nepalensis]MBL7513963.1 hypothetical protein [Frankia nepalensis]MBL7519998.1 hypothetical protein [Frankia nepalensis]MBL7633061.1 hypothetical protein [Frankia nepalensis]